MKREVRAKVRRTLDSRLSTLPPLTTFTAPKDSWIKAIRESLGMSAADLGVRMGIAAQNVLSLEDSEAQGRVRVESLRRAAEALDCQLVYALVPRSGLEATVRRQAESVFEKTMEKVSHSMKLESQATTLDASEKRELLEELINSGTIWRKPNSSFKK